MAKPTEERWSVTRARWSQPKVRLKYQSFSFFIGGDQAEKMVKHCFSDPWKGSDSVLVVEDEKFHVHRVILSLNSPVFEAMFNSQFKESTTNEIPLPEKSASGVLDFLKIIYGFQYIQERVEITSKYFSS